MTILPAGTYIAVEGAIGVGKTSLARILAEEFDARLVTEAADANPYLKDFYRDPRRFALQVQLNFLLSRHRQQTEIRQTNIFHRSVVTDYIYEKDRIFAYLNLEDRDLELYNRISGLLSGDVPTPDLVVFLQAPPERLLVNIRIRDRDYEHEITLDYLARLCEAYHQFFFHYDRSPLLIVNVAKLDFVGDPAHRRRLVEAVSRLPSGTTYLNPEA